MVEKKRDVVELVWMASFWTVDVGDRRRAVRVDNPTQQLVSARLPLLFTEGLVDIVRRYRGSVDDASETWARMHLAAEVYGNLGEVAVAYDTGLGLVARHTQEDPLAAFGWNDTKTGT